MGNGQKSLGNPVKNEENLSVSLSQQALQPTNAPNSRQCVSHCLHANVFLRHLIYHVLFLFPFADYQLRFAARWRLGHNRKRWHDNLVPAHPERTAIGFRTVHVQSVQRQKQKCHRARPKRYVCQFMPPSGWAHCCSVGRGKGWAKTKWINRISGTARRITAGRNRYRLVRQVENWSERVLDRLVDSMLAPEMHWQLHSRRCIR